MESRRQIFRHDAQSHVTRYTSSLCLFLITCTCGIPSYYLLSNENSKAQCELRDGRNHRRGYYDPLVQIDKENPLRYRNDTEDSIQVFIAKLQASILSLFFM